MRQVTLQGMRWYGNRPRTIFFPDRWEVEVLMPPGFSRPALDPGEIAAAVAAPIGSPTLGELAARAREAVIVFDDMTRITPVSEVLPPVLAEMEAAGLSPDRIRLIPALGMHGAMNNLDFRNKLGDRVLRRYQVFNHNPYENCILAGNTPSGTPVYLNREFMECDLRVGIGSIAPHVNAGFGGGGKILLPGISGHQTIKAFHGEVAQRNPGATGMGVVEGNPLFQEILEVTKMSGLQFKVDVLLNLSGGITHVFAGDPIRAHACGIEEARIHCATPPSTGNDIVVLNAYAKYNELYVCLPGAYTAVNYQGGTIVMLVDAPDGQVCHYLMGRFGKEYGGFSYDGLRELPETVKLVICTAYPDRSMCNMITDIDRVIVTGNWDETLELLERDHPGEARVVVLPDGTMQYFRFE